MDMQTEFMQILEEKAGLDEATAARVARVALDFNKEHAPDLLSQHMPAPLESRAAADGDGGVPRQDGAASVGGGVTTPEAMTRTAPDERPGVEESPPAIIWEGPVDTQKSSEDRAEEHQGGLGGWFSHLTRH